MRKSPINCGSGVFERDGVSFKDEVSFRFKREEHLKGRNEIREVFGKGKRIGCKGAKLFVLKNSLPRNRICFTFSRGFGTAVQRNRAKRLGREAYRHLRPRLKCGYDLILLVYPEEAAVSFDVRMGQLEYLCARAGLTRAGLIS